MTAGNSRPVRIFLVGTEFFRSRGGIQYVNRMLVHALADFGEHAPLDLEAFSLNDRPEEVGGPPGSTEHFTWHAYNHVRSALASGLAWRLHRARPDLLLFTHVSLLPLAELARMISPRTRVAVLAHGAEVWRPLPSTVAHQLVRADAMVAPSEYTGRKLVENNRVDPQRLVQIPHGLGPDWTAENDRGKALPHSPRVLLSVARLIREETFRGGKGIERVLRAMPEILRQCPDVFYQIVGDGDDLPRLVRVAAVLGVSKQVQFLRWIDDEALRQVYASADLFVLPTTIEGFGLVFLEAMFNRLPVIAARAAAAVEVVIDGETGILVPPGDDGAIAAAISSLINNPARIREMGEAGRRRVEQEFLFTHFTARWHRWLVRQVPEAVYTARQAAAFARCRALEESPA